jgi:ComEC/Rec2-related protein
VVRASIMAALILIAQAFYRRADLHNIIAAAAVILIFVDPGNLFDIGFQLSFAVTWGLILFLPQINRLIEDRQMSKAARYLLLILFSSLIATLISAPITGYYFGEVSLVTVFSNLVIVPLVSAAVIGIAILLLANLILPATAILPGVFLDRLLGMINYLVLWFDRWKIVTARIDSLPASYVYIFLIGLTLAVLSVSYRFLRRLLVFYIPVAGAFIIIVQVLSSTDKTGDLEIYNTGATQSVIINRGEGAVIFRQVGFSRHDAFVDDLMPYLTRRGHPMPKHFIFAEPRYRVEQRLDKFDAAGSGVKFRPSPVSPPEATPSIWTAATGDDPGTDSITCTFPAPGVVAVDLATSERILFIENMDGLHACPFESIERAAYYILIVADDGEMIRVMSREDCDRAVILATRTNHKFPDSIELGAGKTSPVKVLKAAGGGLYLEMPQKDKK